jgi:hypothetical protein
MQRQGGTLQALAKFEYFGERCNWNPKKKAAKNILGSS